MTVIATDRPSLNQDVGTLDVTWRYYDGEGDWPNLPTWRRYHWCGVWLSAHQRGRPPHPAICAGAHRTVSDGRHSAATPPTISLNTDCGSTSVVRSTLLCKTTIAV